MDNANTVAHADAADQDVVKCSIMFPADLWKEVKKAAIDADTSATQFVVDVLAERIHPKKIRKAS